MRLEKAYASLVYVQLLVTAVTVGAYVADRSEALHVLVFVMAVLLLVCAWIGIPLLRVRMAFDERTRRRQARSDQAGGESRDDPNAPRAK